ncbi:MAG: chemotaxis protein CheR, partial [Myxococcaceae bacterium]|nr:chemotaxis protein CheR [Myxococcaceae bacterium]
GDDTLRCWSVGCASGEEPYTLSILWALALAPRYPGLRLRVLATDSDAQVIGRAHAALYESATLRDLPAAWRDEAFEPRDGAFALRERFRVPVELRRADVRGALPEDTYRLIFCRNLVCTYFDEQVQGEALGRLLTRLEAGGAFVIGAHERLPAGAALQPWHPRLGIHRRPPYPASRNASVTSGK